MMQVLMSFYYWDNIYIFDQLIRCLLNALSIPILCNASSKDHLRNEDSIISKDDFENEKNNLELSCAKLKASLNLSDFD